MFDTILMVSGEEGSESYAVEEYTGKKTPHAIKLRAAKERKAGRPCRFYVRSATHGPDTYIELSPDTMRPDGELKTFRESEIKFKRREAPGDLGPEEVKRIIMNHVWPRRDFILAFVEQHPDLSNRVVENWTQGRNLSQVTKAFLRYIQATTPKR